MDMEPQQNQGQQRYCPTPMAPPPSSPAPPQMQHQQQHIPPPALSPGYYPHSYPPPQQSQQHPGYYPNYYNQAPPPQPAPHYQHHQQQWGHHSYYQGQSVPVGGQQQVYQPEPYPPQGQSPYPPYVQQQQQQQQPQQRMHPGIPGPVVQLTVHPSPPPQQQQSQHALMNLSRFVSQSPCPSPHSPHPHPHSPTTPVPMGSPHYPQPQGLMAHSPYPPQSQTPQGHMSLPNNGNLLHHQQSPYHSQQQQQPNNNVAHHHSHIPPEQQQQAKSQIHEVQITMHTNNIAINNHVPPSEVQNSANDISSSTNNQHTFTSSLSNGGRSESNSPNSVSSHRLMSTPPPASTVSSTSGNGHHMIPVRLQNMQTGARTKAGMRKLMQQQEQQISTAGSSSTGTGSGQEDGPSTPVPEKEPPTEQHQGRKGGSTSKSPTKSPKKSKKGASKTPEEMVSTTTTTATSSSDTLNEEEKEQSNSVVVVEDNPPEEPEKPVKKRGKPGRKPKIPKEAPVETQDTPIIPTPIPEAPAVTSPKKGRQKGGRGRKKTLEVTQTDELTREEKPVEKIYNLMLSPTRRTPSPSKSPNKNNSIEKKQEQVQPITEEKEMDKVEEDDAKKPKSRRGISARKRIPTKKGKYAIKAGPSKKKNEKESEESFLSEESEIVQTPIRTNRKRATKEPTKKEDEPQSEDNRSRKGRKPGKRALVSKGLSRSKSPKDPVLTPVPSPKKSKSPTKRSPKSTTASPSPRRGKETSPSPARGKKTKAPGLTGRGRRGTRVSKELEAEEPVEVKTIRIPDTTSSEDLTKVEPESPDVKSPKRQRKKPQRRDSVTPVRNSSPRQAKDKNVSPQQPIEDDENVKQEDAPISPTSHQPVVSPKKRKSSATSTSITPNSQEVKVPGKRGGGRRKRKNTTTEQVQESQSTSTSQEEQETPEIPVPAKKPRRVSKPRAGGGRGKGRRKSNRASTEIPVANIEDEPPKPPSSEETPNIESISNEADNLLVEPNVSSTATDLIFTSPQPADSQQLSGNESSFLESSESTPSTAPIVVKKARKPKAEKIGYRKRRSNSPRQNIIEDVSISQTVPSPVVSLPPMFPPSIGENVKFHRHPSMETNTPSEPVIPVTSAVEEAPLDFTTTPSSSLSTSALDLSAVDLSMPSGSGTQLQTEHSPSAVKVKKPRKPRVPKVKIEGEVKPKKKTKQELRREEIQRRRADLEAEVEVAQTLLDMKHNGTSPMKGMEQVVQSVGMDNMGLLASASASSIPIPIIKPKPKPRKRKSTSGDISSGGQITPLNAPPINFATLSPDISSPISTGSMSPAKPKRQRTKKPKLQQSEEIISQNSTTTTPTILAVPQINGSQHFIPGGSSSVSFQNCPVKIAQVKVSKTVVPPNETTTSTSFSSTQMVEEQQTTAVFSNSFIPIPSTGVFPSIPLFSPGEGMKMKKAPRPRKKKVVETKDLTPGSGTASEAGANVEKPKRVRRPRKKKLPEEIVPTTALDLSKLDSMDQPIPLLTGTAMAASTSAASTQVLSELLPPPAKKPRKRSPKRDSFKLHPKPLPVPTVFAKPSTFISPNGPGTSSKMNGPTLKVIKGKTEFYRGGEKEEIDAEPPTVKRGPTDYDPSVPWLCCFCNLGPHIQKLGDLFGPYYIDQPTGSGKNKTTEKVETWMHQDCALWAGTVILIGTKLHGLEDTIAHSKKDSCTTCGNKGATIGCLKRGCKQSVHYPCAIRKSWKLDEQTFHSFCPAHIT